MLSAAFGLSIFRLHLDHSGFDADRTRLSIGLNGRIWDNAVTETLFGSPKVERLHGMRFGTRRQAKDEVTDWVTFCNYRRLNSTLGYTSPMAFQQKQLGGWSVRQGRRWARARSAHSSID